VNDERLICDPQRIELFLQQKLDEQEQSAFELHLDDCDDCRRRLEATAAREDIWSGVRDCLQGQVPAVHMQSSGEIALDASDQDASYSQTTVLKLLAPTDDDRMIGRLGSYEVVGIIGSGGMGVVLKAFESALNRYVAIKVLAPHLGSSGAARKRFSREAQAAAAIVHDNVMEIYGVADKDGLPYLVMPYVRGPSLQKRLDDDGPLALVEILRIGMQAAAGLAAAHAQGLVHRDVKPANVLLADGVERVKLTDFGLARAADDVSLTRTGIIAGTPQYMSPEQARGESVDQRSDLFSLGSVLYAMCTGRAPFRAETSYGVLRRVTDDQPRPIRDINPDIPDWLCRIIARLMSKQPGDRFASAREVAGLLEQCLAHVQQPTAVALPQLLVPRLTGNHVSSRTSRSTGVIAMFACLGMGLCGWQAFGGPEASQPPPPSTAGSAEPGAAADETEPDKPPPIAIRATFERISRFPGLTAGHAITVACSLDGRLIAFANGNPTRIMHPRSSEVADGWKPSVQILDAATGEIVVTMKLTTAEEDAVLAATPRISHVEATALAFSPDDSLLAVGTSIGQLKLFDTRTGELKLSFDDQTARLADPNTPENWKTIQRAMGSVAALDFSPDGTLLATIGGSFADFAEGFSEVSRLGLRATGPGRLKTWNVSSGTLKDDLAGHNDHAYDVAFSPNGQLLASAGRWQSDGDFGNGVLMWNPHSGKLIHRLIRVTADGGTRAIAFSPDSKQLLLGTQRFDDDTSTGGVSIVNAESGTPLWLTTVPGWAKPLAFWPDGSVVVLCGTQSIRFLDRETGALQREIRPASSDPDARWRDFAIPKLSGTMAIGVVDKEKNGSVDVWRIHQNAGAQGSAAPASQDNAPASPSQNVRQFAAEAGVRTVACSANGQLVATAYDGPTLILQTDGTSRVADGWKPSVDIRDARTGKLVTTLQLRTEQEDTVLNATERVSHFEVDALAFSPDGSRLAVGTSIGQVKLFDARTGELLQSLDHKIAKLAEQRTPEDWKSLPRAIGSVRSLSFSADGGWLAVCGESFADFSRVFDAVNRLGEFSTGSGRLKIWDLKTGTVTLDLVGHSHAWAVVFAPQDNVLASAGNWLSNNESGSGVILWNTETGEKLRTITAEANGGVRGVAFSPDGRRLAISSLQFNHDNPDDRGTSAIRMTGASFELLWQRTLSGFAKPVFSRADASLSVLCGGKLWMLDEQTGQTLALMTPEGGAQWNDLVTAKDGHLLVIGGVDRERKGTIAVWDFDPARKSENK
jgi:serine/threonine protein kinase/WD40 repeat protein